MNLDAIKSKVQDLHGLYQLTGSYRMKWLDETKPFLQKTLKTISSNTNTNWYVQTVDHVKNLENVNLQFFSTVEVKTVRKNTGQRGEH